MPLTPVGGSSGLVWTVMPSLPQMDMEADKGPYIEDSSLIRGPSPSTPQLLFKIPQIPSYRDYKALNRGTLGGLGPLPGEFGEV